MSDRARELGLAIRVVRLRAGYPTRPAAEEVLPWDADRQARIERGEIRVTLDDLIDIADAFEVPLGSIITEAGISLEREVAA